jgi:GT2 family glycosyltransferase
MSRSPIDIIVPVHNQLDLVAQCISSIINAKCDIDYDIVAIDDASTDEGVNIHLRSLRDKGLITLFTNVINLGFTGTVNFGMQVHPDRDVLLLNSDTIVYDGWLDRIVAAADGSRVATVNPLTNQIGSHISCYPMPSGNPERKMDVSDEMLNQLAAEMNAGKRVDVHTTVGFCMFIRRQCLREVGYFDTVNFPVAYGEESDFCYRARKVGWRHVVAGDVFVTHLEGKSFSERKKMLMAEMLLKFCRLHPEVENLDAAFRRQDPIRVLRRGLDVGRIKSRLAGQSTLLVLPDDENTSDLDIGVHAVYYAKSARIRLCLSGDQNAYPNIGDFYLPHDISHFNHVMGRISVGALRCSSSCRSALECATRGLPGEIGLGPELIEMENGISNM